MKYLISRPGQTPEPISPDAYDLIVSGTAVLSTRRYDRHVEHELSENLRLRIYAEAHECYCEISSTLRNDEIAPLRIPLISGSDPPTALLFEARLHHLRQVFAIIYLIESDRAPDLVRALQQDWNTDLESLLDPDERLVIQAAGQGSGWVTVAFEGLKRAGKLAAKAPKASAILLSAIFKRGRADLLELVRTKLKEMEAQVAIKTAQADKLTSEGRVLDAEANIKEAKASHEKQLAERVRLENFQIQEKLLNERRNAELDYCIKLDKTMKQIDSDFVKRKLKESIRSANPDIPRGPPTSP